MSIDMPKAAPPLSRFLGRGNAGEGMAACWWRTLFPALALFLTTAAFIVTKTGRDALFFHQGGLSDLPQAYLLIAILSAPAAGAALLLMHVFGSRGGRVAGLLLMAALQTFWYRTVPSDGRTLTLFFVLIPLLYGVVLSMTWLLGADLLDSAPRFVLARLYSTMGAASMAGGLVGAAFGKTFARRVEPEFFLLAGAALLTAGALVSVVAHRIFPVEVRAESEWPMPGPKKGAFPWPHELAELLRHRYTLLMAGVGMAASIVGVLIEFQFYSSAATVAGSEQDLLNVFANFYIALNAAAVLIQLFGAPPLQRHLGVHGSLLILPAALTFASVVVAASASVLGRAALRVAEGGLKSSIHRSSWEQAYLPLDRPRRAVAKILVDGVASRLGEGTAAAILILMASAGGGELPWIPILMVFGSCVWVALTVALRRSRNSPGLVPDWERDLRPDLPIPDGCITVGTLGDGLQRHKLSQESNGRVK